MKTSAFLLLCALIGISSCRESGTSPNISGTLAGHVSLHDSTIHHDLLDNFSGVMVSIDGTSLSTSTDSNGYWEIDNVPQGQYNITATKPTFGTYHWYEQNVENGRLDLGPIALAQMSSYVPKLAQAGIGESSFDTSGDPEQLYYGYCDFDSTVQPWEPHAGVTVDWMDRSSNGCYFDYESLRTAGVRPGQTVYISIAAAFVSGFHAVTDAKSGYYDPIHNEVRWASTGPRSNVIAVTMP